MSKNSERSTSLRVPKIDSAVRSLASFFAFITLLIAPCSAQAQLRYSGYEGTARMLDGNGFAYTETHYIATGTAEQNERVVLYRCANGAAFARKTLRARNTLVPQFTTLDARTGFSEGVQASGNNWQSTYTSKQGAAAKIGSIRAGANVVADAGFDEFVRRNWTALRGGASIPLDFVVPSAGKTYGFKVKWLATQTVSGEPVQVFQLAVSGFLGWFADAIEVRYWDSDRTLAGFKGLSNMRDLQGDNYNVQIDFPRAAQRNYTGAAELEAARAVALVNRCSL